MAAGNSLRRDHRRVRRAPPPHRHPGPRKAARPLGVTGTAARRVAPLAVLLALLALAPHAEAAERKVLAHYNWFPVSPDNAPLPDLYACWLTPECEGGKYAYSGGFLRDRPPFRDPLPGSNWEVQDKAGEIATAKAAGIDGFLFNVMSLDAAGTQLGAWQDFARMLAAAARAGGGTFKVVPNIDASVVPAAQADLVRQRLAGVVGDPSVMHLADGRAVVGAYAPERWPDAAWAAALSGLNVAFVPTFLDWQDGYGSRVPQTYAEGLWGSSDPTGVDVSRPAAEAHAHGRLFVAPVRPQDVRPKDLLYWEAKGPTLYMGTWAQAIARADWAQVVTWNDYAEGSQVEPSVGTGWAYAKLTAYYAAWFHAGAAPGIARDDLYYFQRTQRADAPVASGAQWAPFRLLGGTPADDHAWALGFLTAPGTLRVACGAEVWQAGVGAGVQLFPAPGVIGGCAPDYQLVRSGSTVRRLTGPTIAGAVTRQDPLYHAATTAP